MVTNDFRSIQELAVGSGEGLIDRGVNKGFSPPLAGMIVKEEGEQ